MKKYLFFILIGVIHLSVFSQSNFCSGFKEGYIAGYKDGNKLALNPLPPLCPLHMLNESESSYQDGYDRGFKLGLKDKPDNSNNSLSNSSTQGHNGLLEGLAVTFDWDQAIDDLRKQETLDLQARQMQMQNQQNKEIIALQAKEENRKRLQNKIEQLRNWYKSSYDGIPAYIVGGWHKITVTDGFDFITSMYALVENNQITKVFNKPKLYNLKPNNLSKGKVMSQLSDDNFCEFYITDWNRIDYKPIPNEYKNAMDTAPIKAIDYMNRGVLLDLTFINSGGGDRSLSIKEFTKAIELNKKYFEAYFKRAEIEFQCGFNNEAIDDYKKAAELQPQNKECYFRIADLYFSKLKNPEMAINNVDKAIELDPNYVNAYQLKGSIKSYLTDIDGAIEAYSKVLEIDPANSSTYYDRGMEKLKLKDEHGACLDWSKTIEINPQHLGAYYNRGLAKYNLKDFNGAIADYNKAIEINPNIAKVYKNRGVAKLSLKDKNGACLDFHKAGELGFGESNDLIKKYCK